MRLLKNVGGGGDGGVVHLVMSETLKPAHFCESWLKPRTVLLALLLLVPWLCGHAYASSTIGVVNAWPHGNNVVLAPNEMVFLHTRYDLGGLVRFQVTPEFQGKAVSATTSTSFVYPKSGDVVLWFYLRDKDAQVDVVRVTAEYRLYGPHEVAKIEASYPVRLSTGPKRERGPVPEWIEQVRATNKDVVLALNGYKSNPLLDAVLIALFVYVLLIVPLVTAIFGLLIPIRAFLRWEGRWKSGAAITVIGTGTSFIVPFFIHASGFVPLLPFFITAGGIVGISAIAAMAVGRTFRSFLRTRRGPDGQT
jgi:hypothetical protein